MPITDATWAERQQRYWEVEGQQSATDQLGRTCTYILICQVAFVGLDWLAFPSQFVFFFLLRLIVDAFVLLVLLKLRFTQPNWSQLAVSAAVGAEILAMIYASERGDTLYFAGLILVLVGMPVLQPISVRGSVLVSSFCTLGFFWCIRFGPAEFDSRAFVIQTIFILSGALESAFSCRALSENRVIGFEQRTEIEAARDALASLDEAKDRFAANVHHELRTPLTLILAPLDTLLSGDQGPVSAEVTKALGTMHVNGRRLLKLINNLLDLAKLESARFEVNRRLQPPGIVIDSIVSGARPLAERKCLSLSTEFETERQICCDADALEKVVMNLVGNALKFTADGGSVVVRMFDSEENDGVVVRVEDTGIGLSRTDVARVFDRFAQVDGSATREHEGTGIGLSLAKELVELHGGEIWAESEGEGCGASMCFWLPRGEEDEYAEESCLLEGGENPRSAALEVAVRAGTTDGIELELGRTVSRWESRRGEDQSGHNDLDSSRVDLPDIVVVDDNADMRELLDFILGREFNVHLARNGAEGLILARTVIPDLVVTDIMMPEMTGTELCGHLKSSDDTRSIPVMLVSSKAEGEMKVEGLELGADDYVTKPFHPKELLVRARGLVRFRVLQRELNGRNLELQEALFELKDAEAQLVQRERLAAVGELAAGVAHEVNNPVNFALNAVRAMKTELLYLSKGIEIALGGEKAAASRRQEEVVEEVAEATATIVELGTIVVDGLERTQKLVGDLRDFASPSREERTDFEVRIGIESTLALLRPSAEAVGVVIRSEVGDMATRVVGDPNALNQVTMNLVKNSIEAFDSRGGEVDVLLSEEGECVRIRVSDNGPGMSEEAADHLFDPFFTTKSASGGTGLGLSISRRIARDHGGDLEIVSSNDTGTIFELYLPKGAKISL